MEAKANRSVSRFFIALFVNDLLRKYKVISRQTRKGICLPKSVKKQELFLKNSSTMCVKPKKSVKMIIILENI